MTLEQIEAQVLALPKEAQATLLARLLGHLGETEMIDADTAEIWANEAERRDRAMENTGEAGIPAAEVFRKIRTSLQ